MGDTTVRLDNERYTRLQILAITRHTTPEKALAELVDDAAAQADATGASRPDQAAQQLAEALGWERVPELTAEEKADADARLAAAEAEARRIYGQTPAA